MKHKVVSPTLNNMNFIDVALLSDNSDVNKGSFVNTPTSIGSRYNLRKSRNIPNAQKGRTLPVNNKQFKS